MVVTTSRSQNSAARHINKYRYKPLKGHGFQFRLLRLLPGQRGSPIRIEIEDFLFESATCPPYEALSYVWGDPNDKVSITVCQDGISQSLAMTKNCEEALQYLRLSKKRRTLWIDAICINQSDDEEKADQVFNMVRVYQGAQQVVAWLGPASPDTHIAISCIQAVNRHVEYDPTSGMMSLLPGGDRRYMARKGNAVLDRAQRVAIISFFLSPWFHRLWIWQEIRSGGDRSVLKCGGHALKWSKLSTILGYLAGKSPATMSARTSLLLASLCNLMHVYDVATMLCYMQPADCLDPRDRIYVAEALVLDGTDRTQPDYTAQYETVYTDWVIRCVGRIDMTFLRHAGIATPGSNLPSWVPDWSRHDNVAPLAEYFFANGGAKPVFYVSRRSILRVSAIQVTKIMKAIKFDLDLEDHGLVDPEVAAKSLRRVVKAILLGDRKAVDLTAFVRALYTGRLADRYAPPLSAFDPLGRAKAHLESFVDQVRNNSTVNMERDIQRMSSSVHEWIGRSFFETRDGQFGLCPSQAKPGDSVVVALGCGVPLILRCLGNCQSQVIGSAYVEGLMCGEAILGPLPEHMECVQCSADKTFWPALRSKSTGAITFTDPRLPPLPEDWQDVTSKDRPYDRLYKHSKTGEERNVWSDPRCDVNALKQRGVKVQTFNLV